MKTKFAIVGSGWRSEFFLRIAEALPDRFQVTDMVIRSAEKGAAFAARWGVRVHADLESLMRSSDYSFVVLSVPRQAAPELMIELAARDIPVLCETPPAADLEALAALHASLRPGARIQVAEQYLFQPHHAARLSIAASGKLGTVTQAQISAAHDYHGISLMRRFLGVTYEEAEIRAFTFQSPIIKGPGRHGGPEREELADSRQTIASFHFPGKLGMYDFTSDQYFSWIRSPRILIRGEKGEIVHDQVKALLDYQTPVELELRRIQTGAGGNLEGFYLKAIALGEEQVYRNPFIPGRLADDEIAVATCLEKMGRYAAGGAPFYSLQEASQDLYLALMVHKAAETGETVRAAVQPWAI